MPAKGAYKKPHVTAEVWSFLKNPVYQEDIHDDLTYRINFMAKLLVYAIALSFFLGLVIGGVETFFQLDFGKHALDDIMETYSAGFLLFAGVVLAPLIEELLFRGPLYFFRNYRFFNYVFYALTLIFGFYHISNFEITTTTLALSPLLVTPQLCVGVFLGFIRVRFGLPWAIAFHAGYNLILMGPIILLYLLDIPLE